MTALSGATIGEQGGDGNGRVTVTDGSAAATYIATLPNDADETASFVSGTNPKVYLCSQRAYETLAGTLVSPPALDTSTARDAGGSLRGC